MSTAHRMGRWGRYIGVAVSLIPVAALTACGARKTATGNETDLGQEAQIAAYTCPAEAASSGAARPGPANGTRLQVVTTVAPITSIVANIAGDRADVVGAVPEGTNSHTYEPKPSVARVMSTADVVFANGLKLEDPTLELATNNAPKTTQIIELGTIALPQEQIGRAHV